MAAGEARGATFRLTSGKRTLVEIRAAEVVLGSHSSADLVLADPLVAGRHARVASTDTGFVIEDLGGATGTFVNGLPVEGRVPLGDGARIVLGVTRLVVALGEVDGRPLLAFAAEEARFHFKFRDPEAFRSDPDEWTRSEVRFGRVPLVATLGWCTALLGAALLLLVPTTRSGVRLLSPGPLDGSHAQHFAATDSPMDCASCHTGRGSSSLTVAGCAGCHGDMLSARHPFHATPTDAEHGRLPEGACTLCHSGHGGRDREEALELARARAAATACEACHAQGVGGAGRALAAPTPGPRPYSFDPFSHAAHLAALPDVDCARCHEPAGAGQGSGQGSGSDSGSDSGSGSGFAAVSHRTCLGCHDAADGEPDLRGRLELAQLLWSPAWHGSAPAAPGTGCLACHAEVHEGALALQQLARPREAVAHWIPRDHGAEFAQRRCGECHARAELVAGDGARRASAFDHALHLATLAPPPDQADAHEGSCLACHADVAATTALEPARPFPPLEACSSCHVDADGTGTVLGFEERGAPLERTRVPFSHAQHLGLDGGCHACHSFEREPDRSPAAALTRPEARSCLACHTGHANLGGGSCQGCHPAEDPATQALFGGRRPMRSGGGIPFPHHGRGHAELMHTSKGCYACHPKDGLETSRRVEDLVLAPGTLDLCRACHSQEGRPFHWF